MSSSSIPPPNTFAKAFDLLIKVTGLVAAIVTCIVGVYTYSTTVQRDVDQSADKKRELKQKDDDLFYKQSDVQRAKDLAKSEFLQKNLTLLTSAEPGAMRRAEALIDAIFTSADDASDVKAKARRIHESAVEPAPATVSETSQFDYKAQGFQYANAGLFTEAALSFGNAVSLLPQDIQAWNALAYAQLRRGDTDAAFNSISRAIELKPTETGLARLIALNATKILCAQGNNEHARDYLKRAMDMNPQLPAAAKGDGELQRFCGFQVK